LTTTGSSDFTTVPGVGSILTHVQFDANTTTLYSGFAEDRLTSVRPIFSRFLRTISAFCPDTSEMVICVGAALMGAGSATADCCGG
jgi:hypothetical protein